MNLIQKELQRIRAKNTKPFPNMLTIALDDGRIIEIRTRTAHEKGNVGDYVFDHKGNLVKDGDYDTAETMERITVKGGQIVKIVDISDKPEPVETMSKKEVYQFVNLANRKVFSHATKGLVLKSDLEAFEREMKAGIKANEKGKILNAKVDKTLQLAKDFQEQMEAEIKLIRKELKNN